MVVSTKGAQKLNANKLEEAALRFLMGKLPGLVEEAVAKAVTSAAAPAQPHHTVHKRPSKGGVCEAVWKELDAMYVGGVVPSFAQILRVSKKKRWNENNTRVEYYNWRQANGITGRLDASQSRH